MFSNSHDLTVEWGDCDPAGIVFYPRFFAMFDAATAFLLEAASGMPRARLIRHYAVLGWPMVDTRSIFRRPVTFDDRVRIDSHATRVGTTSFTIEHRLLHEDILCVECTETRVWAVPGGEPGSVKSQPLPDALRLRLSQDVLKICDKTGSDDAQG
jgi:4-hydroxybenzoyl-CoA thioesterase